jgi:site-specific DNA-adenine methylase
MKETNLIGRLGNKDNDIKYFLKYLPLDIKNVIEPFGGSFSVIRNIYRDDKYNKYVNDNDDELIEIYKNPEKFSELTHKFNNIAKNCLNERKQVDYELFLKKINEDKTINQNEPMFKYLAKTKTIKGKMIKVIKNINHTEQVKFMKKINFSFVDYMDILNKWKNNKETFIFLDPPYLFSDNSQYSQQKRKEGYDMTDMIYNILNIMKDKKTKAKIMLIINDMKIIRYLYGNMVKDEYDKIYQIGKRKDKHLIICNYNI